jgi:DNA-directed RNA polymerase subunit RPC12/RpoP
MKEQNFYYCTACKEFFSGKELIIDGGLHCPRCGGPVSPSLAHADHRGQKTPERKIFKYLLRPTDDEIEIAMLEGSEILTVQIQRGIPCIWAIGDTGALLTPRRLCIRGTGRTFKGNEGKYIGTFQLDNGDLVFHVFEERR